MGRHLLARLIPKPSLVKEELDVKEMERYLTEPGAADQEERGASQHTQLTLTVSSSTTLEESQLKKYQHAMKQEIKNRGLKITLTETSHCGLWESILLSP